VSVPLRDIVNRARDLLGEQIPNFWNQNIIIDLINEALQDMCSDSQNLETLIQFPPATVPGNPTQQAQETMLPVNLDQVLWVGFYAGQFFQLQPLEQSSVLVANKVQGIPIGFYTRTDTQQVLTQGGGVTPAGETTGDMYISDFRPNPAIGKDYFTALGLWPIPQSVTDITISCTRFHERVEKPLDRCGIPRRFIMGPISYVMANSKLKQENMDVAASWEARYEKVKREMNNYYVFCKQMVSPPEWGGTMWPSLTRGSSSVIFVDQNPSSINALW
jgi:hypothetical protein